MGCKGVVISEENSRIVNLSLNQDLKKVMPTDSRGGLTGVAKWCPLNPAAEVLWSAECFTVFKPEFL